VNACHADRKTMLPPTLLFICLLAMLTLRLLVPGPVLFSPLLILSGLAIIVAGLFITTTGDREFKQAHTPVSPLDTPKTLVTAGLFRYTRNPMYLGFALILAGVWLMLGALSPLAGVLAFAVAADRWYIPAEEKKLLDIFGQAYRDYQHQARRWI
jgi:protein-S-isoprenylcysteine O-methyltransferase Ste14